MCRPPRDVQYVHMTRAEALRLVKERYGLLDIYVSPRGQMFDVVAAERELQAIPEVEHPGCGLALLTSDVIALARGVVTIDSLVRSKNPELFTGASLQH